MPDDDSKGPRLSRREKYQAYKFPYDEPPEPDNYEYLLKWAFDAGLAMSGGMGAAPITSQELACFSQGRRLYLSGWEFERILEISRTYVNGTNKYKDKTCTPPYESEEVKAQKAEHQRFVAERKAKREQVKRGKK